MPPSRATVGASSQVHHGLARDGVLEALTTPEVADPAIYVTILL